LMCVYIMIIRWTELNECDSEEKKSHITWMNRLFFALLIFDILWTFGNTIYQIPIFLSLTVPQCQNGHKWLRNTCPQILPKMNFIIVNIAGGFQFFLVGGLAISRYFLIVWQTISSTVWPVLAILFLPYVVMIFTAFIDVYDKIICDYLSYNFSLRKKPENLWYDVWRKYRTVAVSIFTVVIVICYYLIRQHLQSVEKNTQHANTFEDSRIALQQSIRAVSRLFKIFLCSYCPYAIFNLVVPQEEQKADFATFFCYAFLQLNPFFDALMLIITLERFANAFFEVFTFCRPKRNNASRSYSELTRVMLEE